MDTIVYFYKKRGIGAPEPEPVGLKTYLLIRVGLDVGKEEWFGRKLKPGEIDGGEDGSIAGSDGSVGDRHLERGSPLAEDSRPAESGRLARSLEAVWDGDDYSTEGKPVTDSNRGRIWRLCHPLRALRQRRENRLEARRERELGIRKEQERERQIAAREQLLREVEAAIGRLWAKVEEFASGQERCYFAYEDSLRRVLVGEKTVSRNRRTEILPVLWQRYFQGEEFQGYAQQFWVEQILPQAVQPHFIILGTAACLFDVIENNAHRMKSLRWILPETDCDEELLGFVEDFCTEYGLAIMLEPFRSMAELKGMRLVCGQPVSVLDFTGEAYMAVAEVPEGSIWLDMFSVEEKRRRIDIRGRGVMYISLKEKWKTVQRRCVCPIVI